MRHCPLTGKIERKQLFEDYRKEKRERGVERSGNDGHVDLLCGENLGKYSSLFSAMFFYGTVKYSCIASQGSDANIPSLQLATNSLHVDHRLEKVPLQRTRVFSNDLTSAKSLRCSVTMTADVQVRARHISNLACRGMKWIINDDEADDAMQKVEMLHEAVVDITAGSN